MFIMMQVSEGLSFIMKGEVFITKAIWYVFVRSRPVIEEMYYLVQYISIIIMQKET